MKIEYELTAAVNLAKVCHVLDDTVEGGEERTISLKVF